MDGLSYPVEMHTEVFVCYLGFALQYSEAGEWAGGGIGRKRDKVKLAKMLIIIETRLWVHSGLLLFSFCICLKISITTKIKNI